MRRRVVIWVMGDDNLQCVALQRCGGRGALDCVGGRADDVEHQVGVGEHGNVAAGNLSHFGAHALRKEPFQIRVDGAVVFADDVPARLRLPSSSTGLRVEQVGLGNSLRRPNELLLLLRKVSAEILRALRTQPDTSVTTSIWEKTSVLGNLDCCV